MRIPVYFIQEISVSILCLVSSAVLYAVGFSLVRFLKRGKKHDRHDR
jgi:hypothetical protein